MLKKILIGSLMAAMCAGLAVAQTFNDPGKWNAFNDAANGGSSTIKLASATETVEGKETLVFTATGAVTTKYQYGFVGIAIDADKTTLEILKTGKGISFKTKGDGKKYRVKVETTDITDYDVYGYVFVAPTDKAKEFVIKYSDLTQEGWGAKKKFNPANIVKISFQTIGQPIPSFSIKLFDLKANK